MRTTIAVLNKHGQDSVEAIVEALESPKMENQRFTIASASQILEAKDVAEMRVKKKASSVVIGCGFSSSLVREKPQIAQFENAAFAFNGRLYTFRREGLRWPFLEQRPHLSHTGLLKNLLKETEGDFSILVAEAGRILAARDPMGVQPLYYGENSDFAALATNRAGLWELGIDKTFSFPPGCLACVDHEGIRFTPEKKLVFAKARHITMGDAATKLQSLLEQSVRVRVRGLEEVAVAFSGGLDSSVIAFLAKKCPVQIHLVHVSLRDQTETEEARKAAAELNLPLSVYLFDPGEVERTLGRVVELIEDPDPVKAAIGVPFFWIAQKTVEAGFDVLLAGQGADELFGGYQRYVNEYLTHGKEKVVETMFADVLRLNESNIERDEKICGFHGLELRLPFASFKIAEFAVSLPVELKIEKRADGLRKLVLRKAAMNMGLPETAVSKPKKALQYATGVNAVLGKLAKRQGLTVRAYVERLFVKGKTSK